MQTHREFCFLKMFKIIVPFQVFFEIFTPHTPSIIGTQSIICKILNFSFSMNIPARIETTVIIFENEDERTAEILVVE